MKKTIKLLVVAAIACITAVACVAFAGCGEDAVAVELSGIYNEYYGTNHKDTTEELAYTHEYTLEVYSDNTYKMVYDASYAIPYWTGAPERTVIQYGTYTKADGPEEGTVVYNLEKPTRVIYMAKLGGQGTGVVAFADSANWSQCYPMSEETGGLTYALHSRADAESYETPEQLINTLGRTYKVTAQVGEFHKMQVEVTSHKGDQINGYDNIFTEDEWPAA